MRESNQPLPEVCEARSAYACWEALQEVSDQIWKRYEAEFVGFIKLEHENEELERLQDEFLAAELLNPEDFDDDEIPF